jgi:hypothetical protein
MSYSVDRPNEGLRRWLWDVEVFSTLKADIASKNTEQYTVFYCCAASRPFNYVPSETTRRPSVSRSVQRQISLRPSMSSYRNHQFSAVPPTSSWTCFVMGAFRTTWLICRGLLSLLQVGMWMSLQRKRAYKPPHACMSACKGSRIAERISIKFLILDF